MADYSQLREDAIGIFKAGVDAVAPRRGIQDVLKRDGDTLILGEDTGLNLDLSDFDHVYAVGFGKAGYPMAAAVEEILGDRLEAGAVIVKHGHREAEDLNTIRILEAGHPKPDQAGRAAAREILQLLDRAEKDDLVLVLVSGGGSALFCSPADEISLTDLKELNRLLLGSGMPIHEMNAVRKHVSQVKGGRAAKRASPARIIEFSLSDVVGDDPGTIASGPFAPDETTYGDARDSLERYGVWTSMPESVRQVLEAGCHGERDETPKPGDAVFERVSRWFCGNNSKAQFAAAECARQQGYQVHCMSEPLVGDVEAAARNLWEFARREHRQQGGPLCVIAGGETTVDLGDDPGKGGRNQELAVLLAVALEGRDDVVALSAGTDGNDGPTDAAGGVVDGRTVAAIKKSIIDFEERLRRHAVYSLLEAADALFFTGPTNTNVMDVQVVLFG